MGEDKQVGNSGEKSPHGLAWRRGNIQSPSIRAVFKPGVEAMGKQSAVFFLLTFFQIKVRVGGVSAGLICKEAKKGLNMAAKLILKTSC